MTQNNLAADGASSGLSSDTDYLGYDAGIRVDYRFSRRGNGRAYLGAGFTYPCIHARFIQVRIRLRPEHKLRNDFSGYVVYTVWMF